MTIDKYCVYVTIYHGKCELPMFYIGSTTINKILRKNKPYKGSVSSKEYRELWKRESKDSPNDFIVKILKTFQSRNDAYDYERYVQKYFSVVQNEMYVNKSYANDSFNMHGKKHTPDTKQKMRDGHKRYNESLTESQRIERYVCVRSRAKKGEMTMWDTKTKSYIRASISDPKYLNGIYIANGYMRTHKSREKTSISLKGRVMYHDPTTNKITYLKKGETPSNNLVAGAPENFTKMASEKWSNMAFYHDPTSGEQVRCEGVVPDGFVKGRNNFGEKGNPFSYMKVGFDVRTGKNGKEQRGSHDESYIIPITVKKILKFENIYTTSNERMVEYLKTLDIKITKNMLFRLKRGEIVMEKIIVIDVDEYVYDSSHQWI